METIRRILDPNYSGNILLLNPRMPIETQNTLTHVTHVAEQGLSLKGHVWLATSGSTARSESAVKMVALSKQAILASARAVNEFVKVSPNDIWAQVLPSFHVGGLGIVIRAALSGSQVVDVLTLEGWNAANFCYEVSQKNCTLISLVPTQVYDLVSGGHEAPKSVRVVFVGGGKLEKQLYLKARELGWPLLPSYGMTETSSMIFCAPLGSLQSLEYPQMECLPHAEVQVNEVGFICIKAHSLLSCYAQMQNGVPRFWSPLQNGWFVTEDRGDVSDQGLQIFGRHSDYIKIGGEGVNVANLRSILDECALKLNPDWAQKVVLLDMPSERLGAEIQLVSLLTEVETQELLKLYSQRVMPFEKIRKVHYGIQIPRSPLGKILWAELRSRL